MECYKHPKKEAVAKCAICGQAICEECNVEIGGSNYCKYCVNSLITKDIAKSKDTSAKNENTQSLEDIDPISEPQTIPYNEGVTEKINPDGIYEETQTNYENEIDNYSSKLNSDHLSPKVKKDPENYEPEYDYEPEYVETYGNKDYVEDSYYENPEQIPEPLPEYQRTTIKKPIVPEQARTSEHYYNDDESLELKYERYLEDLYNESTPNYTYDNPHYAKEQRYESFNNYSNESNYQNNYLENNSNFIVPAHQVGVEREGQSYEEIKRQIEVQNNTNNYGDRRKHNNFRGYDNKYNQPQDLEYIKKMHYEDYEETNKNNKFTTIEIILTIILIILIIIVVFYLIYLFSLKGAYPTFMDSLYGLIYNPGLFLNNLMH